MVDQNRLNNQVNIKDVFSMVTRVNYPTLFARLRLDP
jgi:hypothetical protein